jgi:hypothetical protein
MMSIGTTRSGSQRLAGARAQPYFSSKFWALYLFMLRLVCTYVQHASYTIFGSYIFPCRPTAEIMYKYKVNVKIAILFPNQYLTLFRIVHFVCL